ncbi:MAG: FAD binding domain-containing protein [Candidatus Hodarchaeales archaeon]
MVGNICTASPAGDSAPSLLVLEALVEIAGMDGIRTVAISEFFTGVKKNCLKKGEIVTKIIIPELPAGTKSRYIKMKRGAEDLAVVGTAGIRYPDGRVYLAYSSVAPVPVKVDVTEEFKDNRISEESINTAVKKVLDHVSPISDVRGGKEYRNHLVDISTRFVLNEILGGSEQ